TPPGLSPRLQPRYMYISSGEVAAKELISNWFRELAGRKIRTQASHLTTEPEIRQTAPILFGTPRTNKHIRSIYAAKRGAHFSYQPGMAKFPLSSMLQVAILHPGVAGRHRLCRAKADNGRLPRLRRVSLRRLHVPHGDRPSLLTRCP